MFVDIILSADYLIIRPGNEKGWATGSESS